MKSQKEYRIKKGITKRNQLSQEDIDLVMKLRNEGMSYSKISRVLDRNESTIFKTVRKYKSDLI